MTELLTAVAIVFVLEGMLPAISPSAYRKASEQLGLMPDKAIRIVGLTFMVAGAVLIQLVN